MAGFRIVIKPPDLPQQWKNKLAGLQTRLYTAIDTAMNMTRSMLEQTARIDIASGGYFGMRWIEGLHVDLLGSTPNMKISMYHDVPYASIFESGGAINGNLLWIPLSGTDAAGVKASEYPGGLFAPKKQRATGAPLLFSLNDKMPRYFGVGSVNIPRKWHLKEDVQGAVDNFRNAFDVAWKQS